MTSPETIDISFVLNGTAVTVRAEARKTLLDCLREDLGMVGVHVGCEHGVCGCCNVTVDDELMRSCLLFAFQAQGRSVRTIESVEGPDGTLSPLQEAFCEYHALQCGYCTPGMIMTLDSLLKENPQPSQDELIDAMSGNICRCTGYQPIVDAANSMIAANSAAAGSDQ